MTDAATGTATGTPPSPDRLEALEAAMTPAPWKWPVVAMTQFQRDANDAGVVALRNAFPDLLVELRRLEAEVSRLRAALLALYDATEAAPHLRAIAHAALVAPEDNR